ncbi:MAG: heme-binding domain-containing protein [Acidobacteriaceae bacterium]
MFSKQKWTIALIVFAGVGGMMSRVHPFGDLRTTQESNNPLLGGAEVPPEVRGMIEQKCADCHSQRTAWPAYSRIPPISWLIERDVHRGRDHMDLSHWQQYSFEEQQDLLQRIASESRSGAMPPAQYTLIHRGAKLPPQEAQQIYEWAKGERKRLKTGEEKR